ncbi:Translocon-associated protein gamma subunit (TRAP-gamma) family protein [Acanthocheilonema viteae]
MSKGGGQKLSKEDELLLKDFSAAVSTKGSALFYGNSTVIAIAPLYLFYGIHQMEIADSWIVWLISSLTASYLISFAYKNIKHILKHKIVVKRSEAITREMNRKLADDKKMSKKEKDERILWKKNEVGDYEATTFSIFWNNILFLSLLLVLSFFLFASISSTFNCLFSMVGAAGLVALFSTAK